MLATFDINIPAGVRLIDPLGFMEFLTAESGARLVLTDSGGVQEECCILGVPCVTIRENTERPETVRVGANVIAGYSHEGIVRASKEMLDNAKAWDNPFGDGHAGKGSSTFPGTVRQMKNNNCYAAIACSAFAAIRPCAETL